MPASQILPKRQKAVWQFIAKWNHDKGYPPTYREIAEGLNMASVSTVVYHLTALEKKGYIRRTDNAARSIELLIHPIPTAPRPTHRASTPAVVRVPIIGEVAAGAPSEAHQDYAEYLHLPASMLGGHPDAYLLRVRGESMVGAGIGDGDLVLIKPTADANHGDIVVASLGKDATLKWFIREGNTIILRPDNPDRDRYKDIVVSDPQDLRISGKLVEVIRRYAAESR